MRLRPKNRDSKNPEHIFCSHDTHYLRFLFARSYISSEDHNIPKRIQDWWRDVLRYFASRKSQNTLHQISTDSDNNDLTKKIWSHNKKSEIVRSWHKKVFRIIIRLYVEILENTSIFQRSESSWMLCFCASIKNDENCCVSFSHWHWIKFFRITFEPWIRSCDRFMSYKPQTRWFSIYRLQISLAVSLW